MSGEAAPTCSDGAHLERLIWPWALGAHRRQWQHHPNLSELGFLQPRFHSLHRTLRAPLLQKERAAFAAPLILAKENLRQDIFNFLICYGLCFIYF